MNKKKNKGTFSPSFPLSKNEGKCGITKLTDEYKKTFYYKTASRAYVIPGDFIERNFARC